MTKNCETLLHINPTEYFTQRALQPQPGRADWQMGQGTDGPGTGGSTPVRGRQKRHLLYP